MKLFKEKSINTFFNVIKAKIKNNLENINEEMFMRSNSKELAEKETKESQLTHFSIDLKKRTSKVITENVSAERLKQIHPRADVVSGEKYLRTKIIYSYDLPKYYELLSLFPSTFQFNMDVEAKIDKDKLVIEFPKFFITENLSDDEQSEVKVVMKELHTSIENVITAINFDIDNFNKGIGGHIKKIIEDRREKIEKRNNLNDNLNDF